MSIASELIKAREDLGLTQSQLAAKSQVSLSALKGYETGRNMPGARELRELCQALQITPNKLLFGTDTPFRKVGDFAEGIDERSNHVRRERIAALVHLLSFEESYAIYRLVHSIAIARHGDASVRGALEVADLFTAMKRLSEGKSLDMDLVMQNPELASKVAKALRDVTSSPEKKSPKK